MKTEAEWKSLESERDALILAVADHVTVRAEQYGRIQELSEALAEWKACAYRSQTDCAVVSVTLQEMREALGKVSMEANFFDVLVIARTANEALATPDTSAQILARRDAAIWLEAAEVCTKLYDNADIVNGTSCIKALRTKADELLKGLEKEHEQPL